MNTFEVSILIPAYNEEAHIEKAVRSVRDSFARLPERSYEVIVCDNNSTDRTAELAIASGAKVVFEPHNQIARARNTAAREAKGSWFIFLDADTLLNPQLLSEALSCLQSGQVVGGGSTLAFDGRSLPPAATALTWFWNTISKALRLAAGSFIFCTCEAWAAVDGFDEEFYAGEELFFSKKLKRWGHSRGQRFVILSKDPIVTSARKLEWFNQWQLLTRMLLLALPGALQRRESCSLWYQRPAGK